MSITAALTNAQRRRSSLPFVTQEDRDQRSFYFTSEYHKHHVVLRFLPGDPSYRILQRHHIIKNGWTYRDEICRDGCPVCAYEAQSGETIGNLKVRVLTNVVILDDSLHPENVGKVFLYECGEQIAKMIDTQVTTLGVNVFDVTTGNPFWLAATWRKNGTPDYRLDSGFYDPQPLDDAVRILADRYCWDDYPLRSDEDILNSFKRLRLPVLDNYQQLTDSHA